MRYLAARNKPLLAGYELVLLVFDKHPLANIKSITAENLANETLLTFPVSPERLDILTEFLNPACVKPANIKKIESIELMLQMTALGRGICMLPEWLADDYVKSVPVKKIRLGVEGIHKKLFAVLRTKDIEVNYIKQFIEIGKNAANKKLQHVV